jgi:hypothetical protein
MERAKYWRMLTLRTAHMGQEGMKESHCGVKGGDIYLAFTQDM